MFVEIELVVGMLVAVAALALLAQKTRLPLPILLVAGGLLLGLVPGFPKLRLEPDLIFLFFLPPLLYPAAVQTSWRDFRANLRPILLLAVGLVLFTTCLVGWLAPHFIPGLTVASAFVLGAIISPPDAVAATAITENLPVPRRIITVLDGESLVNDATALVAYRFAVAAVVTGTFSLANAGLQFIIIAAGGIALGLAVGWLASLITKPLDDPATQITVSLLTPFAAYLAAESLHVSGVLAVVTAGLYFGWRAPDIIDSRMRLRAYPFWEMVVFLLNGFIFILIGMELPEVMLGMKGESRSQLIGAAVVLSALVILIRIVWVYAASYLPRYLFKSIRDADPYPGWRNIAIVAWTGIRGVVSLAAALALPATTATGAPFPGRNEILFFTFVIIVTTLVLQSLSLPVIIRWLGVKGDDVAEREEREARLKANEAALSRLKELADLEGVHADVVERLRVEYEDRIRQLEVCDLEMSEGGNGQFPSEYQRLQYEALIVERQTIVRLRNERVINDQVMRRIEHDLDLAEARLKQEG
ncbi:MAG: Na+/H+ antiporter [Pedosphaera sp.]|nr:Na+/H+ antiporter [Pedosphaera sp.]